MDNNSRSIFLAEIASMYYDQNMTQQEIAAAVGLTRSAVSRLLTDARARGIVEIIVHYPWRTAPELEKSLQRAFPLKAVRVLQRGSKSYPEMLGGLGVLAAQYFSGILNSRDAIGVSWGTGLYQMMQALRPVSYPEAEVIQLVGGTGTEKSSLVGPLLPPLLANLLGCSCRYLHAPLATESEAAREALLQERAIRETLERAEHSQIALVGIGSTDPEIYNPYRLGYISQEELEAVRAAGAIGSVCGTLYALDGEILDVSFNRRVVALSLTALRRIPVILGVAGGAVKAEAILGALRGGYVNVLVTDDQAARRVLELSQG